MIWAHGSLDSEQFIHDELLRRAARAVSALPKIFARAGSIKPSLLIWPRTALRIADGRRHDGIIFTELPTEHSSEARAPMLRQIAERTAAYALLLVEEREGAVRAIFESPHGTRAFRLPIERHGDVRILGAASAFDGEEKVGILWRSHASSRY